MYESSESEMDLLTPVHLLYGSGITLLPYKSVDENVVNDPNLGDGRSKYNINKPSKYYKHCYCIVNILEVIASVIAYR